MDTDLKVINMNLKVRVELVVPASMTHEELQHLLQELDYNFDTNEARCEVVGTEILEWEEVV